MMRPSSEFCALFCAFSKKCVVCRFAEPHSAIALHPGRFDGRSVGMGTLATSARPTSKRGQPDLLELSTETGQDYCADVHQADGRCRAANDGFEFFNEISPLPT
jgi:hypothetical protein